MLQAGIIGPDRIPAGQGNEETQINRVVLMGRKKIGDSYEILNGRVKRPGSSVKASIAALQWAAERAGLSYGVFTQRLSPADEVHIQQAYDDYRKQRAKELEQHRKRYE